MCALTEDRPPVPTLFVDRLTVIDCAVLDARRGLVGASWIVDVRLTGALDEQGMVFDFGDVKRSLRAAIDAVADHRLVVPARHPALALGQTADGLALRMDTERGAIRHLGPPAAVCLLPAARVTSGALRAALIEAARPAVPDNVRGVDIRLRAEAIRGASYCYAHGLPKHAGACQRIAHGHRSRLRIWTDDRRRPDLEQAWAERWRDIYLGSRADLMSRRAGRLQFGYRAGEGAFELELPAAHCDLLDTASTVEHIAEHIAERLAHRERGVRVRVQAFEGVDKGAIAEARA